MTVWHRPAALGTAIALAIGLACLFGLWLREFNQREVSLVWPAVGIGAALAFQFGSRALPWILVGHAALWLPLGLNAATAWAPPLLTLEAALAAYLGKRLPPLRRPDRTAMARTLWRLLCVPWLVALPAAAALAWTGALGNGHGTSDVGTTLGKIAMSHVHGMVGFGPLAIHFLQGDFRGGRPLGSLAGLFAAILALLVMVLSFSGFLNSSLGMTLTLYLDFPLVMMAGLWLRPAASSCFAAIWCLVSTALYGLGTTPSSVHSEAGHPLQLGIYNVTAISMTYVISVGSSRFLKQLRRNEQAWRAAGVELWEWNRRDGYRTVGSKHAGGPLGDFAAGPDPLSALALLAGVPADKPQAISDRWKHRHEEAAVDGRLLVCSGQVLARERDGLPQEAIGILQDLSAIRRAEQALMALGYQQAQLKSLQCRLNPHFLFNSLNAAKALTHMDPARASEAISTLARLLRANLRNAERPLIPLAEEMRAVADLLYISKLRFEDRLVTRIEVDPAVESHPVPPMLVFNLVENAVIHGIEKQSGGGLLSLMARAEDRDTLHLEVCNPGLLPANLEAGIGTRDVRQRLELIFGGRARFALVQADPATVRAELRVPANFSGNDELRWE